jgi:hypothetical protein
MTLLLSRLTDNDTLPVATRVQKHLQRVECPTVWFPGSNLDYVPCNPQTEFLCAQLLLSFGFVNAWTHAHDRAIESNSIHHA